VVAIAPPRFRDGRKRRPGVSFMATGSGQVRMPTPPSDQIPATRVLRLVEATRPDASSCNGMHAYATEWPHMRRSASGREVSSLRNPLCRSHLPGSARPVGTFAGLEPGLTTPRGAAPDYRYLEIERRNIRSLFSLVASTADWAAWAAASA
jgi:hypothetical protein